MVRLSVGIRGSIAALLAALAGAAELPPLNTVCKTVERRYNSARSLTSHFEQRYRAPGRLPRAESGELSLLKPARMRWNYATPQGKTFVTDGKWIWFYSPAARKVERSVLRDTDDFRAPLAFLLGKLDFHREFGDLALRSAGDLLVIDALPRNGRLPYAKVEFSLTPEGEIRRVVVTGTDQSVMDFGFSAERLNATVAEAAFRFFPPAGIPVVDVEAPGDLSGTGEASREGEPR